MATVKVKWGKELLELTVDPHGTLGDFREALYRATLVPAERQKILGIKLGPLSDGAKLSDLGVSGGKTLMLLGTPAEPPKSTAQPAADETAPTAATSAVTAPPREEKLPVGIMNIGNTCYMNAALQMLRLVPELRELLRSSSSDTLLSALHQLYTTMDTSNDAVTPLMFLNALITHNPTFGEVDEQQRPMQHDAQEALNTILQRINSNAGESHKRLFSGTLKQTTTCKEDPEDTPTVRELPFVMLSCNISTEVQMLEAGLDAVFNETVTFHSERLAREALYSRTCRISVLPEYLFVHLVRFSWRTDTQAKAKILKPISFPIVLDVFTLCTDELKERLKEEREAVMARREEEIERRRERGRNAARQAVEKTEEATTTTDPTGALGNTSAYYELCGVISHKGRSADGGHYVFWGRSGSQWMVCDDKHVAVVREEDVMRLRGVGEAHIAYVLMYRSRDPWTKKPVIPL